jgi:oligopeptide transport system permease protein
MTPHDHHRPTAPTDIATNPSLLAGGAVVLGPAGDLAMAQETNISAPATSPLRDSLYRFRRDRRAMGSLVILSLMVVVAFILPIIYQHIGPIICEKNCFVHLGPDVYHTAEHVGSNLESYDQGPSSLHWLGTNSQGQDLLARLLDGVRVSIEVSILVVGVLDVGLGIFFGVLAGYFGGLIDALLARFTDIVFAFPGLLFAVLATAIFGQQAQVAWGNTGRLILVSLTLGITIWPQMARYVRGQTLQLKEQQFVEAARTIGTTSRQIITRHIIPNIASLIIVAATLDIAGTVVNEGVLSLLGLGVQAPASSLGVMINEELSYLPYHPWEDLLPAFVLTVIVLALSFIGDGLRDALDPRSKD